jgi:hypothetical protein
MNPGLDRWQVIQLNELFRNNAFGMGQLVAKPRL